MYQNLIQQKDPERARLAALMAAFPAHKVQVLGSLDRPPIEPSKHITDHSSSGHRARAAKAKTARLAAHAVLIERAKAMAAIGLSAKEAHLALRDAGYDRRHVSIKSLEVLGTQEGFAFANKGTKK
jgi:hypothetical protein